MPTTSPSLLDQLNDPRSNSIAWHRFVKLYTPLLMHWVGRLGLQENESVDVVQDVMVSLMARLPSFRYDPRQSFRSWLRTVTLNQTRDFLRKKKVREKHEARQIRVEPNSPQSVFTDQEFSKAIAQRALLLMKEEFEETTWRACWASTVHGQKATEIARDLGISVNAVYLAKGRVLKRLRKELEGMI